MHIFLIHGQGRSPLSMTLLGWRLKREGYTVHYFGYAPYRQTFEQIAARFVRHIRRKAGSQPYAIVGHSLGSIVTRASLPHLADHPPRHVVMLAPPNMPAKLAKKMQSNRFYRLYTRDCGRKLADDAFYRWLPEPDIPTTVIAGTKGLPKPLSPFGNQLNDTILSVAETRLNRNNEVIKVPAIHALIMNSKQVADIIIETLPRERQDGKELNREHSARSH